jgi:hypothetical protein
LEIIMHIFNFQKWKLPPSNFSMTFKDSIWKDDILLNTNVKTNILCLFYSNELQVINFKLKNLLTFEELSSNLSHSITIYHKTKPLQENPQTFEKKNCTNLKFHLKFVKMAKNFLWNIWNFKLSTSWKPLFHTPQSSTLKFSTTWNLKT